MHQMAQNGKCYQSIFLREVIPHCPENNFVQPNSEQESNFRITEQAPVLKL